jgi:hypothetical protein
MTQQFRENARRESDVGYVKRDDATKLKPGEKSQEETKGT